MLESALNGCAFGFGAMFGIFLCWISVGWVSKDARKANQDFNKEAIEHWKRLEAKWSNIADYIKIISDEVESGRMSRG